MEGCSTVEAVFTEGNHEERAGLTKGNCGEDRV